MTKPLVAVPTLFPDYTADELHAKGFSMVIFANQPMRAAVKAMEDTLGVLRKEGKPAAADPHIAAVDHIFDLVHTTETIEAEEADEASRDGTGSDWQPGPAAVVVGLDNITGLQTRADPRRPGGRSVSAWPPNRRHFGRAHQRLRRRRRVAACRRGARRQPCAGWRAARPEPACSCRAPTPAWRPLSRHRERLADRFLLALPLGDHASSTC